MRYALFMADIPDYVCGIPRLKEELCGLIFAVCQIDAVRVATAY